MVYRLIVYFCNYLSAQHPVLWFWMCVLHLLNSKENNHSTLFCQSLQYVINMKECLESLMKLLNDSL